jgi:hypothetical protein
VHIFFSINKVQATIISHIRIQRTQKGMGALQGFMRASFATARDNFEIFLATRGKGEIVHHKGCLSEG